MCIYNIDKGLEDDKGKRAQDYALPTGDEQRRRLVHYEVPEHETYPQVNDPSIDIDQIDFPEEREFEEPAMFKIVITGKNIGEDADDDTDSDDDDYYDTDDDDDDDDDESNNRKRKPRVEMIDMCNKLNVEGAAKSPCWGVHGKHKEKWVGNWGRYLTADTNRKHKDLSVSHFTISAV